MAQKQNGDARERDSTPAYPEWVAAEQLCEYAAGRPHVHAKGVARRAKKHFRGAVPQCEDFVGVHLGRHGKGARQPKVGNLDVAMCPDQDIFRLQVTVNDAMAVAVVQAAQQLLHHRHRTAGVQWVLLCHCVHDAPEVLLDKLEVILKKSL